MRSEKGFTLIEILIVVMLIGIIAIVAFPQFFDMRADAKDASTKGALGGMRGAISVIVGVISLKENPASSPAAYPTVAELTANALAAGAPANHAVLVGKAILDKSAGIPVNPWTNTATIHDCTGQPKGTVLVAPNNNDGWCYDPTAGLLWANSALSANVPKENTF